MHIHWPGDRCILCLKQTALTNEHVIPESIGGRLTSNILCAHCNSTFGSKIEAAARSDPSIRIAVENLSGRIPEVMLQILNEGGLIPYIQKHGDFKL